MKYRLTLLLLAGSLALFTGCQTIESRIKDNPQVFAQIDPPTQEKIKKGIIDLGYTQDMIYLALGAPDQKKETITSAGRTMTWIYNTYYDPYYGGFYGGYYPGGYYYPMRPYRGYYPGYYYPGYGGYGGYGYYGGHHGGHVEERVRVIFNDGRATVIEQAKD